LCCNQKKIDWCWLSDNPYAINLLEANINKGLYNLCLNTGIFDFQDSSYVLK